MEQIRAAFAAGLAGVNHSRPVLIASHNDADGLAAAAILARAFAAARRLAVMGAVVSGARSRSMASSWSAAPRRRRGT
jgi:single-stranded DNA-specific DHH superfamily exonuclease